MPHYRIFDQRLDSAISLPELQLLPEGPADLTFEIGSTIEAADWRHVHDWVLPDGTVSLSCSMRGTDFLLDFPGLAKFRLGSECRRIIAYPRSGTDEATLRHLLLDQVVPRIMGHHGRLSVHAAAVLLENGTAIAFAGETGWGKSTLVSALHRSGVNVLTDDCLLLETQGSRINCIPAYHGVRLLPDSVKALFPEVRGATRMAQYADKLRVPLASGGSAEETFVLSGLYLLSDPSRPALDARIRVAPAIGSDAVMALIACLFALDMSDQSRLGEAFLAAGRVINSGLPVYRLGYPRRHEVLAEVCEAILASLSRGFARPAQP